MIRIKIIVKTRRKNKNIIWFFNKTPKTFYECQLFGDFKKTRRNAENSVTGLIEIKNLHSPPDNNILKLLEPIEFK